LLRDQQPSDPALQQYHNPSYWKVAHPGWICSWDMRWRLGSFITGQNH